MDNCCCYFYNRSNSKSTLDRKKIYPNIEIDGQNYDKNPKQNLIRSTTLNYSKGYGNENASPKRFNLNEEISPKPLKSSRIASRSIGYLPVKAKEKLSIYICTWNMNGQIPNCSLDALFGDPTKPLDTKKYSDCQIIIIGTQECEKSLEKSLIFKSNKSWEQIIDTNFGKHFDRLKTESLMGLHMIILIRKSFRNHVHDEKSCRLATGIGNVIGNKGAVGISFMVDDTSFLFVNAHLSAHEGKTKFRNKDYNRINLNLPITGYRQKDQQKKSISDRFDHCFFFGDLNYRIDLTRPVVDRLLTDGRIDILLCNDELLRERSHGNIFKGYQEPSIHFYPTYKFDTSKSKLKEELMEHGRYEYDSSSKQRIPSWTDRILYHSRNQSNFNIFNIGKSRLQLIDCEVYQSCFDIQFSDHRPVYGIYSLSI